MTALLRHKSHTAKFTLVKCTIHWSLVYSQYLVYSQFTKFQNIFIIILVIIPGVQILICILASLDYSHDLLTYPCDIQPVDSSKV